jgi:general transcription factor 3C polypeptide 5 (transcription factor C subunit 1)
LRQFRFKPGVDRGPNVDVLPPPIFTHMSLPFNYNYSQNPYVRATGDGDVVNLTAVKQIGHFIGAEDPTPEGPQHPPDMTDLRTVEVLAQLEEALNDRPIWTRRALLNHLGGKLRNWNELKKFLSYVAYQFKGGPWRDAVVMYGVDPRTDPTYRIYQTVMFKLPKQKRAHAGQSWTSLRKTQMGPVKEFVDELSESHVFDGNSYHADGKTWQVCDVIDPLLKELLDNAAIRPSWDMTSGWYHGGLWAKVKAIMKTKLVALRFGKQLMRRDFEAALQIGDQTPIRGSSANFHVPVPNLKLTEEEHMLLRGKRLNTRSKSKPRNVQARNMARSPSQATESNMPRAQTTTDVLEEDEDDDEEEEVSEEEDSGSGEEDQENNADMNIDPALRYLDEMDDTMEHGDDQEEWDSGME